jgi:hypothetical protein
MGGAFIIAKAVKGGRKCKRGGDFRVDGLVVEERRKCEMGGDFIVDGSVIGW